MPRKRGRSQNKKTSRPAFGLSDDPYLLDEFSEQDLSTWKRQSSLLSEYRVKQFYYLESLRTVHKAEILESLEATKETSLSIEDWVRIVDYKYSLEPLHATGSLVLGGRFNIGEDIDPARFPAFPALYIAQDYPTAYAEKFGELPSEGEIPAHELALRKASSFTSVQINGDLVNLFDLRTAKGLKKFAKIIGGFKLNSELIDLAKKIGQMGPSLIQDPKQLLDSLLDPNWRRTIALWDLPANSQLFAQLVKEAGFEGIIFKSTKGRGFCISLFIEQLEGSSSYLCLADDPPASDVLVRLDSSTWKEAR